MSYEEEFIKKLKEQGFTDDRIKGLIEGIKKTNYKDIPGSDKIDIKDIGSKFLKNTEMKNHLEDYNRRQQSPGGNNLSPM